MEDTDKIRKVLGIATTDIKAGEVVFEEDLLSRGTITWKQIHDMVLEALEKEQRS